MKIELGKAYRTRSGKKIRIICADADNVLHTVVGLVNDGPGSREYPITFTTYGSVRGWSDQQDQNDLIEEWKDTPVFEHWDDIPSWHNWVSFNKGLERWLSSKHTPQKDRDSWFVDDYDTIRIPTAMCPIGTFRGEDCCLERPTK